MQTASAPKSHQVAQVLALSHPNRVNRGYRPEARSKRSCSCGRTLQPHVIFDDLCDYCLDEMAAESEASFWGCC